MLKIKVMLFVFPVILFLQGFSQDIKKAVVKDREGIIEYKVTISKGKQETILMDTLLIRNSFVLEPLKVDSTKDETNLSSGKTRSILSIRKLQWYYLTDLSKMIGMGFNIDKQATADNIKLYTSKTKDLGYGIAAEPFLFKNGYQIKDYSKVKDTLYNGQKCFVIIARRNIALHTNSSDDELVFTRMIVNPQIEGQYYPFISEVIARNFGGAIMFVESGYHSGLNLSIKYDYKTALTPAYCKIFDKYLSLYISNVKLFDRLKN